MNKKLFTVVGFVAVSALILPLGRQLGRSKASVETQQTTVSTIESPRPGRAPEHVVYWQFFRHLLALRDRASALERAGGIGAGLRSYYKDKAKLTDQQALALDQIASTCAQEVAVLDAQAKVIIDAFRTKVLAKNSLTGGTLPPLPPELRRMQQQRNMIIMRYRELLRTTLGQQGFKQLDDFIKIDAERNARPAQITQALP